MTLKEKREIVDQWALSALECVDSQRIQSRAASR